jgi:hypothetical protein
MPLPGPWDSIMNVTAAGVAAQAEWLRDKLEADDLGAELGCEVIPHPALAGIVEACCPVPGVWLLAGTPGEVRAEARRVGLLGWLAVLGNQRDRTRWDEAAADR